MALIIIGIYTGLVASEIYKYRTTKNRASDPRVSATRAPRIEVVGYSKVPILIQTNRQVVIVDLDTPGLSHLGVTANVDGLPAQIERWFGEPNRSSSFHLRLPRMEEPGEKTLTITFGSEVAPITTKIVYSRPTDQPQTPR